MIDFCGQKLTNNWKRQKQLEINKKIKIYESNRWVSQYKNLLDNGMIDFNEKWQELLMGLFETSKEDIVQEQINKEL